MQYADVSANLAAEFQGFTPSDVELPYIVTDSFACYLLNFTKTATWLKLAQDLEFIESQHHSTDNATRELAAVGFLEISRTSGGAAALTWKSFLTAWVRPRKMGGVKSILEW